MIYPTASVTTSIVSVRAKALISWWRIAFFSLNFKVKTEKVTFNDYLCGINIYVENFEYSRYCTMLADELFEYTIQMRG